MSDGASPEGVCHSHTFVPFYSARCIREDLPREPIVSFAGSFAGYTDGELTQ